MRSGAQIWFLTSLFLMRSAHAIRVLVRTLMRDSRRIHGVRVIAMRADGEILLVRHWYAGGAWTLPGGGIKRGETLEQAALRELYEETGYRARGIAGVLGIYQGKWGKGDSVAVVIVRGLEGALALRPNFEIVERGFFSSSQLPEYTSPANRKRIEEYVRGERSLAQVPW